MYDVKSPTKLAKKGEETDGTKRSTYRYLYITKVYHLCTEKSKKILIYCRPQSVG